MADDYFDLYNRNRGTSTSGSSSPYSSFGGATGTGYTPPSTGTQAAQSGSGGANMGASDWWDAARFAYGVYRDRNPPDPKFKDVPLSPEQKQMYQIYIQSMLNPATVNNASALNSMATQMLGGLSGMKWQSPQTFNGQPGYSGSDMSFTPPWSSNSQTAPRTGFAPDGQAWTPQTLPNLTQPQRGQLTGEIMRESKDLRRMAEGPRPPAGADFAGDFGRFAYTPSRIDEDNFWRQNYTPHPFGDPTDRREDIANRQPSAPDDTPNGSNFWSWLTTKIGSAVPDDEEGRERWAARGLSLLGGAMGFPVPPNLLDRGWDGLQWLYRRIFSNGQGAQPATGAPVQQPPGLQPSSDGWGLGNAPGAGYGFGGREMSPYGGDSDNDAYWKRFLASGG